MSKHRQLIAGIAAAASILTFAAGCAAPESGGSANAGTGSNSSANVEQVKAEVEALGKPFVQLTASGAPFDALAATKGKTVGVVAAIATSPVYQQQYAAFSRAAETVGMNVSQCDGETFNLSAISRCISLFTNQGVDAIVMSAVDPNTVQAPLAAAKKAGVLVVAINAAVEDAPLLPNVDAQAGAPFRRGAELEAKAVIAHSDGKAQVLVIHSSDYVNSGPMKDQISKTFASDCPQCKVIYRDVPIAGMASKLVPTVQSTVISNPGIDYVIPLFDDAVIAVNSALNAAGATGRVKVVSFNATEGPTSLLAQDGNPLVMDIGASQTQIGYAWADVTARLLAGEGDSAALRDSKISLRIFTQENVHSIDLKKPETWYGDIDVADFYRKQWNIS